MKRGKRPLSEPKTQKIQELQKSLLELGEKRKHLSTQAQAWRDKRNALQEQIRKLRIEVTQLKEKRDAFNHGVQELKELREKARKESAEKRKQIVELKEKTKALMEKKPPRNMEKIRIEIENLEWKIQTTPLSVQEEKPLIEKIKQLEVQMAAYKQIQKVKQEMAELQAEQRMLETSAKEYHEKLLELAEQSQKTHERMIEIISKARALRTEADDAHKNFVQFKQQASETNQKYVQIRDEIHLLEQELRLLEEEKKVARESEIRKELEQKAREKLKRGEKLTWEEFQILAEKGIK